MVANGLNEREIARLARDSLAAFAIAAADHFADPLAERRALLRAPGDCTGRGRRYRSRRFRRGFDLAAPGSGGLGVGEVAGDAGPWRPQLGEGRG